MKEIKSLSDFNKLKDSAILIIDFFATWCGPCKAISPTFEKLSAPYTSSDSITFAKCDVDKAKDVAQICGISAMPTFQFFKNGTKVDEIRGADVQQLNVKIGYYTTAVAKDTTKKESNFSAKSSSDPKSLRDLIDSKNSKLLGTSNLSSIRNIISPPPAGYAIASATKSSQLLMHVVFSTIVKPDSIYITMMKDSISSAPSRIEIGSNVPVSISERDGEEHHDLDMNSLSKAENVQSFNIFTDEYIDGTAKLKLKASKFSSIKSLTLRIDSNLSGDASMATTIGKIDISGIKT
ncbi:hypothetical protein EPUL_002275 [Erysiphe pulchra]|uniref:Thioredoxin domain-containing protein n=1 Tax=Erysiphe pulchra TaxID=225359 RepID=A0A2S4PZ27_9PEZI|nr:hypothetical protein EPUL_002275 [Erysiphe pulchra]